MSHQPFETWIFEPEELSQEQREQLQTHLDTCHECCQLKLAWQDANVRLQVKPMVLPAPGFSQRWEAGLERRQVELQTNQSQQVQRFLLYLGLSNALAIITFLVLFIMKGAFLGWIIDASQKLLEIPNMLIGLVNAGTSLLEAMPDYLSFAAWIAVTCGFCILTVIWVYSLWRTTLRGVTIR
jgi:hypothetical protein